MPTEEADDSHFSDRYIEVLRLAAVPEKNRRWYLVRIERYIAAHPESLTDHAKETVHGYLSIAGCDPNIPSWLFRQLTHALQLLFTMHLSALWANESDWQYWLSSGCELEATHLTVARYNAPMKNAVGAEWSARLIWTDAR